MKNVFLLSGLCCLLTVFSCKYPTEYQDVNAGNQFSISLPPWMKVEEGLKPGAQLQYANRYRNFYVIGEAIAKTPQDKPVGDIMSSNLNILRKAMKSPIVTDSTAVNISGLSGIRAEIYGKMNNENIYFTEAVIEGKSKLYHISIWTRGEERKLRFKEDINKILASFKEINGN
jgi:hypothetical protein